MKVKVRDVSGRCQPKACSNGTTKIDHAYRTPQTVHSTSPANRMIRRARRFHDASVRSAKVWRFFFAAQDAQHAEGEGFHLSFSAGRTCTGARKGHTLRHPVREHPGPATPPVSRMASRRPRVTTASLPDIFRQIVGHGLVNQRGLPVTLVDAALDFPRVGRPEPVHQPPLPCIRRIISGKVTPSCVAISASWKHGKPPGTLGRERPFIVGNHIHDTPAHMQGKGDPPAHVRDNQG